MLKYVKIIKSERKGEYICNVKRGKSYFNG